MEYQGYKNYETWRVKLEIDNDPQLNSLFNEKAEEIFSEKSHDKSDVNSYSSATVELANILNSHFSQFLEKHSKNLNTFIEDIVNSFLETVDWREIAESLLDDVDFEAERQISQLKENKKLNKNQLRDFILNEIKSL